MKKITKKKKYILACIVILLSFVLARYGWRIIGLRACSPIYSVNVTVLDTTVDVQGYTVDPFGHFIGHTYKVDGDKLYVGVKEREFLGVLPGDKGEFHIQIPIDKQINEVYWCTKNYERLEWKRALSS